jgi:hypothetical protein
MNLDEYGEDEVFWALNKNRKFTIKSLYYSMPNGGVKRIAKLIWKCRIPLNIIFFPWHLFNGKLHAAQVLKKRVERKW